MDGVAKEVMHRPELLVVIEPGDRVHLIEKGVRITALEDVQVAVAIDVSQHILGVAVVALTSTVK